MEATKASVGVKECSRCHKVKNLDEFRNSGRGKARVCRECEAEMKAERKAAEKARRKAERKAAREARRQALLKTDPRAHLEALHEMGYYGEISKNVEMVKTPPKDLIDIIWGYYHKEQGVLGELIDLKITMNVKKSLNLKKGV